MKANRTEAVEVFRQFAWNLAGSLAARKNMLPRPPKPKGKR